MQENQLCRRNDCVNDGKGLKQGLQNYKAQVRIGKVFCTVRFLLCNQTERAAPRITIMHAMRKNEQSLLE